MKRVEITICGQVQGVFFRQETKQVAEELDLTGWVRNEEDSSVMIMAEGREENLQKLVKWCRKGTKWSKVEKIEIEWQKATGEFNDFFIK